jgi:hypothetical protein
MPSDVTLLSLDVNHVILIRVKDRLGEPESGGVNGSR